MFIKSFVSLGAIAGIGFYLSNAFGPSYSRNVGATPAEVRNALYDLDIREAPGEPASDPSRSGGIAPTFQLSEQGNDMIWTIMSGNKVAVRMIAHLTPADGGQHTKVTADVERGDAPDDLIAPAFRSTGLTRSLFGMVLDQELDELTVPTTADPATCQKILDDFEASAPPPQQQTGFGGVARTALKLSALEGRLKSAGCPTNPGKFEAPSQMMSGGDGPPSAMSEQPRDGVNFEPGKPMINTSNGTSH
jgi:hypothetical protein